MLVMHVYIYIHTRNICRTTYEPWQHRARSVYRYLDLIYEYKYVRHVTCEKLTPITMANLLLMPIISDLRKKHETDDVAETFQKSHDGCIGRYWTNAASTLLLFFSWTLSSWLQLQKLKPGLVAVLILRWHMKPLYTVTPYSVYIYTDI